MAAWRDDNDAPARGVINGVALSVLIWLLIGATIYFGWRL